jgi:hypothetical protein
VCESTETPPYFLFINKIKQRTIIALLNKKYLLIPVNFPQKLLKDHDFLIFFLESHISANILFLLKKLKNGEESQNLASLKDTT